MNWYTIYRAKTDEIVACGTADMIVRKMGYTSKKCFYSSLSHHRKKCGGAQGRKKYDYVVQKTKRPCRRDSTGKAKR